MLGGNWAMLFDGDEKFEENKNSENSFWSTVNCNKILHV